MTKFLIATETQYYDDIEQEFLDNADWHNGFGSHEDAESYLRFLKESKDWSEAFKESLVVVKADDFKIW